MICGDARFMALALEQARLAAKIGETPVGAVIVRDGAVISAAHNRREVDRCAVAHAEVLAIREACRVLGGWRLTGCCLYVSLEPCPMCAGAIVNARLPRVVFGAGDPKAGCFGSVADFSQLAFNHQPEVVSGVLAEESAALLRAFFRELRSK
ncbi:MAG: nucleoside deaminase [Oscillospiraceae bacterium]|nr:nucleoside deaminase [Oscillospiraceae bacterium]